MMGEMETWMKKWGLGFGVMMGVCELKKVFEAMRGEGATTESGMTRRNTTESGMIRLDSIMVESKTTRTRLSLKH